MRVSKIKFLIISVVLSTIFSCNLDVNSSSNNTIGQFSPKKHQDEVLVKGGTVEGSSDFKVTIKSYSNKGVETGSEDYEGVFIEGRTVTLDDFYIGKYEVTKKLYKEIMEDTGLNQLGISADPSWTSSRPETYVMRDEEVNSKMYRPVEFVSWYDAVYFCNCYSLKKGYEPVYTIEKVELSVAPVSIIKAEVKADFSKNGYRLPTEAEWEYAARGGQETYGTDSWKAEFSGASIDRINNNRDKGLELTGWYHYNQKEGGSCSNGEKGYSPHAVGLKAPNALGLYDMSGNVFEWVYDIKSTIEPGIEKNPVIYPESGDLSGKYMIFRGGDWDSRKEKCTVVYRNESVSALSRYVDKGFRIARNAE